MYPIMITGLKCEHDEAFVEKVINNSLPANRQINDLFKKMRLMNNDRFENEKLATILLPLDDAIYLCNDVRTINSDGLTFFIRSTQKLKEAAGDKLKIQNKQQNNNFSKYSTNNDTNKRETTKQQPSECISLQSANGATNSCENEIIKENDIVNVVYIEDEVEMPLYFYVTPKSFIDHFQKIDKIIVSLSEYLTMSENNHVGKRESNNLERGDIVLAFSIEHNNWFRGKVTLVKKQNENCTIYFMDYGNYERIPMKLIKQIPSSARELLEISPCAVKCTFKGSKQFVSGSLFFMSEAKEDLMAMEWTVDLVEKDEDVYIIQLSNDDAQIVMPTDLKESQPVQNSPLALNGNSKEDNQNERSLEERVNELEIKMKKIESLIH